jgi:hypothetical protein
MKNQYHLNQSRNLDYLKKVHQNGSLKHLKSVHPSDIGKIGTKMFSKQDGGNVDHSNSSDVDDMNVSYDCELNLSTNLESYSFKEVVSHREWKEIMQKEYDALIKNGTWNLVDPPYRNKPIGSK